MAYSKQEIQSLVERFEACSLPKSEWTHEAHLMVSVWNAFHHGLETSMTRLRRQIRSYNQAVGTPNTDSSGYHETLTRFWLQATCGYLKETSFQSVEAAANAFIKSDLGGRDYPLKFYSKEVLFSVKARRQWVLADKNLP